MYVSSKEAQKYYGVTGDTLRRWAEKQKIFFEKTDGGHRRYIINSKKKIDSRKKVIYARVSSKKQESDLQTQIEFLKSRYPKYSIIKDIGSGINFNRRGFNSLLEQVLQGNVRKVVVYSNDRLARFGQELIEKIFQHFNTEFIIENNTAKNKTDSEELADDLISIITVFTARYYGRRKYNKNN